MKIFSYLFGLTVLLAFLWIAVPAQKTAPPEPLAENASIEETGKWLIKTIKKNYIFPSKGEQYTAADLKFADCLLTFNIVKKDTSKDSYVRNIPSVPRAASPDEPSTSPDYFPAPDRILRATKYSARDMIDTQMLDLAEIDPTTLDIRTLPMAPGVSYLVMVNKSVTAGHANGIRIETRPADPKDPKPGMIISQKKGGLISLDPIAAEPVKAALEHAFALCQKPK
jgi:hypothetical protein